jgi:Ca2+:H+ antiporter
VSLSIAIGTSSAVQVAMIQLPLVIILQAVLASPPVALWQPYAFVPVFPLTDIVAVCVAVLLISFISIDGKSNYFEGAALLCELAFSFFLFFK